MRELRELVLPHLVQARQRQSLYQQAEQSHDLARSASCEQQRRRRSPSTASTAATSPRSWASAAPSSRSSLSDATVTTPLTPATPVFTPRAHTRFPSATSSLASSLGSSPVAFRESLDGYVGAPKRPLTEVREEDGDARDGDEAPRGTSHTHDARGPLARICDYVDRGSASPARAAIPIPMPAHAAERYLDHAPAAGAADYDWLDHLYDVDDFDYSLPKRRRGHDPAGAPAAALGARLLTMSRRWRGRKDAHAASIPESFHESIASRSRASSMRAPSVTDFRSDGSIGRELPPGPLSAEQSFLLLDSPSDDLDGTAATALPHGVPDPLLEESRARTPLLPPVQIPLQCPHPEPVLSPLHSPKIAAALPAAAAPSAPPASVRTSCPSPVLHAQASATSLRHRSASATLPASEPLAFPRVAVPSATRVHRSMLPAAAAADADVPPILLAQPPDEWSAQLGHANFVIHPEPHAIRVPSHAALLQLRADWILAQRHFAQHLASTGEHYGQQSKVYRLTRAKWAAVESQWRAYHDEATQLIVAAATEPAAASVFAARAGTGTAAPTAAASTAASTASASPCTGANLPPAAALGPACASRALIAARCNVKFPHINLEDIVGPMVRAPPIQQPAQARSKKRAFWKFLQGILPLSREPVF